MQERRQVLGFFSATLSVIVALSLLVFLLLVATADTPDRLRQINAHHNYLDQALVALTNGMAVSETQGIALGDSLTNLSSGLGEGSEAIAQLVNSTYAPVHIADVLRWPAMEGLNWIDSDAGELSVKRDVLDIARRIDEQSQVIRSKLDDYADAQTGFALAHATFEAQTKAVVGALREQTAGSKADAIYAATQQIDRLLSSTRDPDLDRVFSLIGQLETAQKTMAGDIRERQHTLINSAFRMNAHRRSMHQAVAEMNTDQAHALLANLQSRVTNDQLYTLGAVNDARVLLNIYTILLLALLAFFGLRLQASHRSLNRSHDDLEQRVSDRTADLELANSELKESQVQLVQAEKMSSLGQLVAGVMHEINTPLLYVQNNTTLTAEAVEDVASYVHATMPMLKAQTDEDIKVAIKQLLARRGEFDVTEIEENLAEVASLRTDSLDGLNQISELVQSLKDFSRLDRIADDRFDVRQGIEKTLTITKNLLKYGVDVQKNLQDVPEIYCSPSRLNQVFINIVTNAVQAMEGKGVLSITTSYIPSNTANGDSVEITFEDTGCGIPQEYLDKIMDPFFTTKPVGQGTGLGLSIVRQIVDQHHGQKLIDSREGHGTRIVLNFPVNPDQHAGSDTDENSKHKEQAA